MDDEQIIDPVGTRYELQWRLYIDRINERAATMERLNGQAATIERLIRALAETWQIASRFSVKPDARCHPDVPHEEMNETAKMVMHTTAQQIAWEIKDFVEETLKSEGR